MGALYVCLYHCLYNLLEEVGAGRIHPRAGADATWEPADLPRLLASQMQPRQALLLLSAREAQLGRDGTQRAAGCFSCQSWAVLLNQ